MKTSEFIDLIRAFFAQIDSAVYGLISIVYNLIEDLANASILTVSNIDQFATRVYSLLGIFMLFRISFSIITYIISPDKLTDNKTGSGNIIKRIIISLILIIFVPTGFNILYDLQSAILNENIIPNFILGTNKSDTEKQFVISPICNNSEITKDLKLPTVSNNGTYISLISFRNFYQLANLKEDNNASVGEDYKEGDDSKFLYFYCGYNKSDITVSYYLSSYIYNYPHDKDFPEIADETVFDKITNVIGTALNITTLLNPTRWTYTALSWLKDLFVPTTEFYYVDYSLLITTLVGIIIVLFLVTMAMDIAVRSIKLAFLQLLSPIPIISYISPDSKSNTMLKNWGMEVFRTWASLFIRLIALFFGIYLIQQLDGIHMRTGYDQKSSSFWIQFFLLIGILIFCKQMPKLLEELIPGFKGSGSFSLRPFKKFGDEALGGKIILGTAGAVGAGAIGLTGAGIAHGIARNQFRKDLAKDRGEISNLRNQRIANASRLHTNNMQLHANKNQIKTLDGEIGSLQSKRVLSINEAAKLKSLKDQKANLEASNVNITTDNKAIRTESKQLKSDMQTKQKSVDEKIANSKLAHNPIGGFMGSISRGAMYGMKEGYKNPKGFLKSGVNAIQQSSQNRNYRDKYGFMDRARDKYTDIVGIKNPSGTTSEVKRDMRAATLALDEVNRNINTLSQTVSRYQEKFDGRGNAATIIDNSTNRMIYNTAYSGPDAVQIKNTMANYNQQLDRKVNIEKQIKDYEGILSSKNKKE